ncbi:phosphopantetheine-binding protein [Nocardia xishanensis]|uniref:phosphopantetheine-binding protein n=1 Tax=Nocardia xishanensis TaxID=238964 RepID=UPI0009FD3D58|nr:phosphopantetheine-binding protein [Nocardia xishanensis]
MTPRTMPREKAEDAVREALRGFATEADILALGQDEPLRSTLELDSIDFLTFVERLSAASSRIEESDYPRLSTIRSCVDFLTGSR